MILHAVTPINRVHNIHVAIPENAEYEAGFYRWTERIARMGENTGRRIFYHGHAKTLSLIQAYLQRYHTSVLYEMQETDGGNELKRLSTELQPDDLMVIIMARHGSVSFRPSLEHVPHQINAYYTDKNFILLFPDSYATCFSRTYVHRSYTVHEELMKRKKAGSISCGKKKNKIKKKIEFPMPQQKAGSKIFTRTKKGTINRNHEFRES